MKIGLTSIYVDDVTRAFAFYTTKLGFISRTRDPGRNLAIVAAPDDRDGTGLLLEPNDSPLASTYQRGLYEAGLPAIVLSVDDVEAEHKRLSRLDVKFLKGPVSTSFGCHALFDDGCGNCILLHKPPA
jgi:predicted enzyme related to lactoylglutathione lyase